MKIHKEGKSPLINISIVILLINVTTIYFFSETLFATIVLAISLILLALTINFYRSPERVYKGDLHGLVNSPTDGKVVAIERVHEKIFFNEERIQVSIFMSVFNVHVNWFPIKGKVEYFKYHPGQYLVAMHPKSSEKNERTTVVTNVEGVNILTRQIAGYLARRIVCYAKEGNLMEAGDQMGFIKFGSRVDLFLPKDSRIQVTKGQRVKGCQTIIAKLPEATTILPQPTAKISEPTTNTSAPSEPAA